MNKVYRWSTFESKAKIFLFYFFLNKMNTSERKELKFVQNKNDSIEKNSSLWRPEAEVYYK